MSALAIVLAGQTHRPVRDATGIEGAYEITLYWTEEEVSPRSIADGFIDKIAEAPFLFGALQSQLGLKLEPQKVSVDIFVIDHIEKTPAEN